MSRENVEIVRRVYEAAARRDAASVLALYDPNVELDNSRLAIGGLMGGGVYHGHEGLRSFFLEWHESWDDVEYDYEELLDAGDGQVISFVTTRGRGRTSGAEVQIAHALVWTVRDGKVVRVMWFSSRQEALEAVGLRR